MVSQLNLPIDFTHSGQGMVGRFRLMASTCEVHIRSQDFDLAKSLVTQVYREGLRIEQHFSRYLTNNPLHRINASQGQAVTLDDEYVSLLNYALNLFQISDGMFDISSGILRQHWVFDNQEHSDGVKESESRSAQLRFLLSLIGLDKIIWRPPQLQLPAGMELDFGGIGKEYAVDRASQMIERQFAGGYLVNFGGDCYCRGSVAEPWSIMIESTNPLMPSSSENSVTLAVGAVATSGTTKRYFESDGRRFGHILNPKTGWPVEQAPLSVTVVNESCLAAGAIATLGMLQGGEAEGFLMEQDLLHWVLR